MSQLSLRKNPTRSHGGHTKLIPKSSHPPYLALWLALTNWNHQFLVSSRSQGANQQPAATVVPVCSLTMRAASHMWTCTKPWPPKKPLMPNMPSNVLLNSMPYASGIIIATMVALRIMPSWMTSAKQGKPSPSVVSVPITKPGWQRGIFAHHRKCPNHALACRPPMAQDYHLQPLATST